MIWMPFSQGGSEEDSLDSSESHPWADLLQQNHALPPGGTQWTLSEWWQLLCAVWMNGWALPYNWASYSKFD